ncbi:MAG TPA: PP2C family protein-serine/threonine phosphatase, partial [Vicinamibacteria bacterium]|nr:PP2C family protein-serine/threonine phosphatase [Vicinamibacteria bacterium]
MTRPSRAGISALAESSRERFEEFASRFGGARGRPGARPALTEGYWQALKDLFTRDVTHEGLRQLLQHETQETFRFLTREVDLTDLAALPWYERQPRSLWRFFLAVAFRLSPWRRVLFAGSAIVLGFGWVGFLLHLLAVGPFSLEPFSNTRTWLLVSATAFFFLLTLELRDKLSLKGDLEVARQIQFGLLPFEPFEKDGIAIATAMRPANTVGGDYFDVIELGDGQLAIAVGDVAGKGMPAALLMALLQGSLRTLLSAGLRGEELVAKLNAHLCTNIPSNRLITLFYGELDAATGRLRYVNAGHNPPFLLEARGAGRSAGHPVRLAATAMALGITTDTAFPSMVTELASGDRLVLYTDGVTEAEDPQDREYGEARLAAWIQANREQPGRRLIDGVIAEVLEHCDTARPR